MRGILFVFRAKAFKQVGVRKKPEGDLVRERLAVDFGIVDRDLDIHMAEIPSPEPLGDAQDLAVGMPEQIERAERNQSYRLDDQRVALPFSNGVPEPAWLRIVRM